LLDRYEASLHNVDDVMSRGELEVTSTMKHRSLAVSTTLIVLGVCGCGSGVRDAFLVAVESGTRTAADVFLSDLLTDLPDLVTLPPLAGEPTTGDSGNSGQPPVDDNPGGGDFTGGLMGDVAAGETLFGALPCSGCHCADASGGCLAIAPNIQGIDVATIGEKLVGNAPHVGGKFPDLTGQDLADLSAFLDDLAGNPNGTPGGGDMSGGSPGDSVAGATLFGMLPCSGCHCADGSGGCLSIAPNIQGVDVATIRDKLQGDTPHTGGKFPDLTDQQLADIMAFLGG